MRSLLLHIGRPSTVTILVEAHREAVDRPADPGFIDHVVNKKPEIVRVHLPPDANSVIDHCPRSRHYVNVVVAGEHPAPPWLAMDKPIVFTYHAYPWLIHRLTCRQGSMDTVTTPVAGGPMPDANPRAPSSLRYPSPSSSRRPATWRNRGH